jgi:hypothetical protein
MDLDIHPTQWLEFFQNHPVLQAAIIGLALGIIITQLVKMTWLAFCPGQVAEVTKDRYTVGCMWFAVCTTWLVTYLIWHGIVGERGHGLERLTCTINGFLSLPAYWFVKYLLIRVGHPEAAAWLGERDAKFKPA